jgi:putative chitinase
MSTDQLIRMLIESVPKDRINGARQAIPLLVKWMNHYKVFNPNHIGYIIGTVSYESAFLPRREIRANPVTQPTLYKLQERYWSTGYYGRGYIQITWKENYRRLGHRIGLGDKLVTNPDLALEPDIAAHIAVVGMHEGLFTGYKLRDFDLPNNEYDFVNARKIVNGLDRAELIASYGRYYSNVVKRWQSSQKYGIV